MDWRDRLSPGGVPLGAYLVMAFALLVVARVAAESLQTGTVGSALLVLGSLLLAVPATLLITGGSRRDG